MRTEKEGLVLGQINRYRALILAWRPSVRLSGPLALSDHILSSEMRILYLSARRKQQLKSQNFCTRLVTILLN